MFDVRALLLFITATNACDKLFVIESNTKSTTNPSFTRNVDSLMQCSRACQESEICATFNFITFNGTFTCELFDKSKDFKRKNDNGSIFAWSFCSKEKSAARSFTYEKFPQRSLTNSTFVLKSFTTSLEECLGRCQEEENCRSVLFNRETSLCRLSKVSLNSVYNPRTFFKSSKNVDLYENNAIEYKMSPNSCTFMRVAGGGLIEHSDQVLKKVESSTVCEEYCTLRTFTSDPCRSYTYDSSTKNCYLEHSSSRMVGKSPLQNMNEHLSHGDLEDCVDFSLKCKETSLEVLATSIRMFQGTMKTKLRQKTACEETFQGDYDFRAKFEFSKCGMVEMKTPEPSFRGMVHVKEGSTSLITVRDKMLQVNCRIHAFKPSDQTLSVSMNVKPRNDSFSSDPIVFLPKPIEKSKFSLRILSMNEEEMKNVHIGENGWIKIAVEDSEDFFVTNLLARDVKTGKRISLMDDDGCVIRKDIVRAVRKDENRSILYQINFSGFEKQTEVVYHATAETCSIGCLPKCNNDLLLPPKTSVKSASRVKRSTEIRKLELITDVYQVQGSRITLLNRPRSVLRFHTEIKDPVSDEENGVFVLKKTPTILTSLHSCLIDDLTCLLTVILASIQLFLLVSCVLIMLCYCQQWRLYRSEQNSQSGHSVEYQISGTVEDKAVPSRDNSIDEPRRE